VKHPFGTRLAILWAAVKHLFVGGQMCLNSRTMITIGDGKLTAEHWVNRDLKWLHHTVTFDGVKAIGYVDGVEV